MPQIPRPESLFSSVAHGFLDLRIDDGQLVVQFYDVKLDPLDKKPLIRRFENRRANLAVEPFSR